MAAAARRGAERAVRHGRAGSLCQQRDLARAGCHRGRRLLGLGCSRGDRRMVRCAATCATRTRGPGMKHLIVNGDDFGASRGVNRGILEAHVRGILTSTSLIVNGAWSEEAAALSCDAPELSVGLHVDFTIPENGFAANPGRFRAALEEQFS